MRVALGFRLTALGVKNHEIALQRYESFLNKKHFSPPTKSEKHVWRDDQERDLRSNVGSPPPPMCFLSLWWSSLVFVVVSAMLFGAGAAQASVKFPHRRYESF